ncbi:MAG: exodeoxyribonuclease VII small subunit [Coriobacteriia bacterium]|nr:exodeoxyribonuclease VII small subunit [Coriobacteriia bacterium]
MSDERYTFEQAKARLEEIASLVRKKDTSLEKSLELLEESVRLANVCTELVDRTDLGATLDAGSAEEAAPAEEAEDEQDGGADDAEAEAALET